MSQRVNNLLFMTLIFFPWPLFPFQAPSIPIQNVEAESIEFHNKEISLRGDVSVKYDMGLIRCDQAIVTLSEKSKDGSTLSPEKIDLFGHVAIDFSDGSTLSSEKGELFCMKREAVFYGSPTEKVVYISYCDEEGKKVPVKASGKKITARIVKDPAGTTSLSDIRGEGAVTIEYLRTADHGEKRILENSSERRHEDEEKK